MPDAARWFGGEPAPPDRDALAAELQRRADHVYAVMAHIATHGHDDGADSPCVEWETDQ